MKNKIILILAVALFIGCGKAEVAKETSTTPEPNLAEGFEHLSDGDVSSAIQSFDMAIQKDPTNSKSYLPLGELYLRLQNYTAAVDTFNAATKVNPIDGEAQYFLALSSMLKAQTEEQLGNASEVDYYTEKALKAGKQSAEIFMQAKDEERFKKAVAIVKSLMDETASNGL